MAANIQLEGFPPVRRLKFFQGTGAKPGRLIVDTLIAGVPAIESLPRITTLTMNARNFSGTWENMRVVMAPRIRNGFMRTVLEDSRWVLRETYLDANYNDRDSLGEVKTGQKKTIAELAVLFGAFTGLQTQVGETPQFEPRAKWAGERADKAWEKFLFESGCRYIYNPITEDYTLAHGGSGFDPHDFGFVNRIFRPGPDSNIKQLKVRTGPVLYEDRMPVKAKYVDQTTGEVANVATLRLPTDPAEINGQLRFRLWAPDSISHPSPLTPQDVLLLDHRAKTHMFDPDNPIHERARVIRDAWDRYPHHQPLYSPSDSVGKMVEITGGGRGFLTDHPVLMTTNGTLSTDASLLTSYYVRTATGLAYNEVIKDIDPAAADTVVITIPWLKPVDSTEPDMVGAVWDDLHDTVAESIAAPLRGTTQTMRLTTPVDMQGSGQIGGMEYQFDTHHTRGRIRFSVALNFIPGSDGSIR